MAREKENEQLSRVLSEVSANNADGALSRVGEQWQAYREQMEYMDGELRATQKDNERYRVHNDSLLREIKITRVRSPCALPSRTSSSSARPGSSRCATRPGSSRTSSSTPSRTSQTSSTASSSSEAASSSTRSRPNSKPGSPPLSDCPVVFLIFSLSQFFAVFLVDDGDDSVLDAEVVPLLLVDVRDLDY